MRLLLVLILIAIVAIVVWALLRRAARANTRGGGTYRVLETTSGGEVHVHITDGTAASRALIGTVAINADDFDTRYAELIARAEDRAATLNAGRELRARL